MPIYEYKCRACGAYYELLVSDESAAAVRACPSCGSRRKERRLSIFAVASGNSKRCPPPVAAACAQEAASCRQCPWEH